MAVKGPCNALSLLVSSALAALGIPCTVVSASERQVVIAVKGGDVLVDHGDGVASFRAGIPGYVGGVPVRYRLEDGSTLGAHGSR